MNDSMIVSIAGTQPLWCPVCGSKAYQFDQCPTCGCLVCCLYRVGDRAWGRDTKVAVTECMACHIERLHDGHPTKHDYPLFPGISESDVMFSAGQIKQMENKRKEVSDA